MNQHLKRAVAIALTLRRPLSIGAQLGLVAFSNKMAFWLRFDSGVPDWANRAFSDMLPWLIVVRGLTFIPFRLYEGLWRYTSISDLRALIGGITGSTLIFWLLTKTSIGPAVYPRSIFVIDALILTIMLGGLRMTRRLVAEYSRGRPGRSVLVVGAGGAGELIVRDMKNNGRYGLNPIGFIDDDRDKVGRRIHNVPVLGTRLDLADVIESYDPDEVLIAIPSANPAIIRAIVRACEPFDLPIKTLPNLRDIVHGKVEVGSIRSLEVSDLLQRAPVGLDPQPLRQLIGGRTVMVTGAGGSIGSELCRQIVRLKPASLVLFERYENSLHAIRLELEDGRHGTPIHPLIGDVTDAARVEAVLHERRPDIIFHAAAHKHVPLMEENPCEAVKNNIRGTRVLSDAAERAAVDRFILISTDKAVNPTSVMGTTKRICELIVQARAPGSGTSFSTVRFGNVLGSNGSVVPRFMDQIRAGGPVTITHPEMRRFFMLIPEAVQLVMHAAAQAESGATYVLEMGEQVKLVDMARDLIRLAGRVPDEDIRIEFIGLRSGEKMYEELVGDDEDAAPSLVEKILCVRSRRAPLPDLFDQVGALERLAVEGRTVEVVDAIRTLVGTFVGASPTEAVIIAMPRHAARLASAVPSGPFIQPCPRCRDGFVHRLRGRSLRERIGKWFTARRLHRCGSCGWRGWLVPLVSGDMSGVDLRTVPDLASIDTSAQSSEASSRPAFSPRHLS